ncbi:3-oxoacyl-ACP reductase FabG [Yinghuangia aomiensis]|uniref:3-oxoacyl-ACP reductase FabG n=1 Tax=Yinghuangia aomiensis TaxID=676205 RepID=A0ABP9H680_9ACTN
MNFSVPSRTDRGARGPQPPTGRVALVTGGGGALGTAVSHRLADDGHHVVVADLDLPAAVRTVEDIDARLGPGSASAQQFDVGDPDSVAALVRDIAANTGRIDMLINNAAVQRRGGLDELDVEDWDLVMAVNVRGPFLLAKAIRPLWERQGGGSVVNVSSRVWVAGGPPAYTTSKAALVGLTRSLARELGPIGVVANAVAPGFLATPFTVAGRGSDEVDALIEGQASLAPLGRVGTVGEVADAIAFLVSDRATFITGEVLHVCGGGQLAPVAQ